MSDSVLEAPAILERFRLDGRTALVTGGGQGIGRGYAHALGEAGAAVAIVDLALERAETVAHELAQKGVDAIAVAADVTKEDQVAAMVDAVMQKWGKLTIGVNNAGIGVWADAEKMAADAWRRVIDLNLTGVFLCAQAEAKVMLPAGYGKIVNTASMSGHIVNTPQNQSVQRFQSGVIHLTRSFGCGMGDARCASTASAPAIRARAVGGRPAQDAGRPTHGAGVDASDADGAHGRGDGSAGRAGLPGAPASDFVTGHDVVIDGGYCVW